MSVAGIVALISIGLELFTLCCCKNPGKVCKFFLFIPAVIALGFIVAAFAAFYRGLPPAFRYNLVTWIIKLLTSSSADKWCSDITFPQYTDSQLFCASFYATYTDSRINGDTFTWTFGPADGWWCCVVAAVVSLAAVIAVCATHTAKK